MAAQKPYGTIMGNAGSERRFYRLYNEQLEQDAAGLDAPKLENKEKAQESIVTKVNKILTDFYKVSNITTAQDKQKRIDANLKKRFEKKYDDGLLKSSVDLSSLREKNAIRFMLDDVAKIASDESKKINATKPGAGGKVEKATAADINRKLDYLTILNSINELLSTDFEDGAGDERRFKRKLKRSLGDYPLWSDANTGKPAEQLASSIAAARADLKAAGGMEKLHIVESGADAADLKRIKALFKDQSLVTDNNLFVKKQGANVLGFRVSTKDGDIFLKATFETKNKIAVEHDQLATYDSAKGLFTLVPSGESVPLGDAKIAKYDGALIIVTDKPKPAQDQPVINDLRKKELDPTDKDDVVPNTDPAIKTFVETPPAGAKEVKDKEYLNTSEQVTWLQKALLLIYKHKDVCGVPDFALKQSEKGGKFMADIDNLTDEQIIAGTGISWIDGILGGMTKATTASLQKASGMDVQKNKGRYDGFDGLTGELTITMINELLAKIPAGTAVPKTTVVPNKVSDKSVAPSNKGNEKNEINPTKNGMTPEQKELASDIPTFEAALVAINKITLPSGIDAGIKALCDDIKKNQASYNYGVKPGESRKGYINYEADDGNDIPAAIQIGEFKDGEQADGKPGVELRSDGVLLIGKANANHQIVPTLKFDKDGKSLAIVDSYKEGDDDDPDA